MKTIGDRVIVKSNAPTITLREFKGKKGAIIKISGREVLVEFEYASGLYEISDFIVFPLENSFKKKEGAFVKSGDIHYHYNPALLEHWKNKLKEAILPGPVKISKEKIKWKFGLRADED